MTREIILATQQGKKAVDYEKHFEELVKVGGHINQAVHQYYPRQGLQYIDVPPIVGITGACENVFTLFEVGNRLGLLLFVTQTGQLALEQALQRFNGVYTVIHSGRDEEVEDERHLRQFRLIEEEFDCRLAGMERKNYDEETMYEALLKHIEGATKAMVGAVLKEEEGTLAGFYHRDIRALEEALLRPYQRIAYEEAITLLNQNGHPELKFGDDLKADHEQEIVFLLAGRERPRPVFVMRYPKEIKFFNMKVAAEDERVVLSADLIFPFAGEGVGSAVREHRGEELRARLLGSTMFRLHVARGGSYHDFKWYIDDIILAEKTYPHAGYGIGSERLIQYTLGLSDIRSSSILHLIAQETGDWQRQK
jgi:asparaginyl-tRNA synthetase